MNHEFTCDVNYNICEWIAYKKKKKSEDRDPILIFSGKEKVVQSQPREGSKF